MCKGLVEYCLEEQGLVDETSLKSRHINIKDLCGLFLVDSIASCSGVSCGSGAFSLRFKEVSLQNIPLIITLLPNRR